MKIAQIAPLFESVPPSLYGGTERIVSYLTEELVRQGHEVTLLASADSQTRSTLVPCSEAALRLNPLIRDSLPYHLMMMEEVARRATEFDVLHYRWSVSRDSMLHEQLAEGDADHFDRRGTRRAGGLGAPGKKRAPDAAASADRPVGG